MSVLVGVPGFDIPGGAGVRNLPASTEVMGDTGRKDPLEEEMAIHSSQCSCLENVMDRGHGGLSPWGHKESDVTEHTRPCFIVPVPFPGDTVDLLNSQATNGNVPGIFWIFLQLQNLLQF